MKRQILGLLALLAVAVVFLFSCARSVEPPGEITVVILTNDLESSIAAEKRGGATVYRDYPMIEPERNYYARRCLAAYLDRFGMVGENMDVSTAVKKAGENLQILCVSGAKPTETYGEARCAVEGKMLIEIDSNAYKVTCGNPGSADR